MKSFKFISTILVCILFVACVSCSGGTKAGEENKAAEVLPEDIVELRADQVKLASIMLGTIEEHSLSGTLKVSGIIAVPPQSHATVCVPMGGFIKNASLVPGSAVRKGQTLAIIENQEFIELQQNFLERSSRLEYMDAEYKRQEELFKENVSAAKTFQQTTAEYKILKSQVRALEQKLAMIGINPARLQDANISRSIALVSPIDGFVKTVNVNIGKFVSPSDVLFEIVNTDKLFLELTLFEKDADKVAKDQKIHFYINNETEQHEAVISQTGKAINADKSYKVYANVTGGCKNVIPGMYVNAIIESSGKRAATLPSEAIVNFEEKDYIFVFSKDKEEGGKPFTEYRMVEVRKGISDGTYTEVVLPKGFDIKAAKVVIKGAYSLLSAKKNAGGMAC